ncbi:ATP-binding cassette domain-containing protein [Candidatus Uabimicrobium sp. HlEnr_7]|uniref:ATP-binding cassette domain-containing protein n=1 Tax=Candidatus Uabimicrobium helgolandensis TaxID=3095367 RepID=UPI003557F666
MVLAENVSIGYAEKKVLEKISFKIPLDKTTVIMGPGASGKTTILKILVGAPNKDNLWYTGDLNFPKLTPFFCPQNKEFQTQKSLQLLLNEHYPSTTAVTFLNSMYSSFPTLATNLINSLSVPLCELPVATAKIAYLSIAFANKYSYVILDEPERYLESNEREWLISKILEFKNEKTIIIASHNLLFSRKVADYVMLFVYGELIESGMKNDFFSHPQHARTKQYLIYGS